MKMKRFLSLALAAVLSLSTASVAFAEGDSKIAEFGGKKYETLAEAVEAVVQSENKTGTVTLLNDSKGPAIGLFNGKGAKDVNLVIDFGGFTYECNDQLVGSVGTESQAFHLEKGNTVTLRNGTIKAGEKAAMLIQNYSDLTLNDLTLDIRESDACQYAMSNNCGKVELIGETNIYTTGSQKAFDVCWAPNVGYPAGTQVTVNTTGTINGVVEVGVWGDMKDTTPLSTITVKNGTFTGALEVDEKLEESAKNNVSIEGGLFTDESWNNDEYTENAEVIAELKNGDKTEAVHIGGTGAVIDATNYDSVTLTKAPEGSNIKVVGEDVTVENGTDKALTVNGAKVPVDGNVVVNRAPREDNGGDYFGNEKWGKVKREIAAAEEGDTIKVSATGLPWFPSSVARALKGHDITLEIRKNGTTYSVNGEKIGAIEKIWYEFDQLEEKLLTAEAK